MYCQIWDSCLCQRDSDGDGKTNGEELGDPDCVWQEGMQLPDTIDSLTHPGKLAHWFSYVVYLVGCQ